MATIYEYAITPEPKRPGQRKADDGKRWEVRYRTPEGASTRKRGFRSARDAEKFLRTTEVSKDAGTFVPESAGKTTVREWYARYIDGLEGHTKATTMVGRRNAWSVRVEPKWGDTRIGDIKVSMIKSWVAQLARDGGKDGVPLGAASIQAAMYVLRGALAVALEDGALKSNPAAGIKLPTRQHVKRGYLTNRQVDCLASHMYRHNDRVAVWFLAYTGLRFGEMAALTLADVDMLRRRVNVTHATAEVAGKVLTSDPKTHERRSVPFPAFLADDLSRLMVGKSQTDYVFTSQDEVSVFRVSTWRPRQFAAALKACQEIDRTMPHVSPHDLRHTAASLAIRAGANVKAVQRMLGHKSAAMTLDTYADLFEDDLDDVAERMDRAATADRERVVGHGMDTRLAPIRSDAV
jgi:integrase